jgi:hypothetical protein
MPSALFARPAFRPVQRVGLATALLVLAFAALLGACGKPAPEPAAAVQPAKVGHGAATAGVRSVRNGLALKPS